MNHSGDGEDEHIKATKPIQRGKPTVCQCMLAMPKECKMIQHKDIHVYQLEPHKAVAEVSKIGNL